MIYCTVLCSVHPYLGSSVGDCLYTTIRERHLVASCSIVSFPLLLGLELCLGVIITDSIGVLVLRRDVWICCCCYGFCCICGSWVGSLVFWSRMICWGRMVGRRWLVSRGGMVCWRCMVCRGCMVCWGSMVCWGCMMVLTV